MKRILLLLAAPIALSVVSCNKSHICECVDTQKNALEHYDIKATKKSDAESKCGEHNDPGGRLADCHLK